MTEPGRHCPQEGASIHRFLLYALLLKSCCLLISSGTTASLPKFQRCCHEMEQFYRGKAELALPLLSVQLATRLGHERQN